jgi:hypothetical protein
MGFVVSLSILLKKVMLVLKFISNLANKELSPSMKDIKSSGFVVTLLLGLHVSKLVR